MVDAAAREGEATAHRGDIDDLAPTLPAHPGQDELAHAHQPEDVGLKLPAHLVERHLLDRSRLAVTGVVDQHADRPLGLLDSCQALAAHREFLTERAAALRLFYVLMFEALGPRSDLAREFARLHAKLRELTVGWVQDAIDSGEMRRDLDATAVVILITGALGGIAYQWLLDPGGFDVDRVYADLERTLERGMR
jgi:hypothetical protein